MYIGTPPQLQQLILDTGSSVTAVDCYNKYNHIYPHYQPNMSTTSQEISCNNKCNQCTFLSNQCLFSISYIEGSAIQGYYIQDRVILGNRSIYDDQVLSVWDTIGCTTRSINQFKKYSANGILGLSPNTNTNNIQPSLVDELYRKEQSISDYSFSICINSIGGYFSIGIGQQQPQYVVNYNQDNNVYAIKLHKLSFNGINIASYSMLNSGYGTFIDSGSTYIHAHTKLYNIILSYFDNMIIYNIVDGINCYKDISINDFPVMQFEFDTFFRIWHPSEYLVQIDGLYCLPITKVQGRQRLILGIAWMRNWHIEFNKGTQQLKFTQSDCEYDADDTIVDLSNTIESDIPPTIEQSSLIGLVIGLVIVFVIVLLIVMCLIRREYLKQSIQY